MLPSYIGGGGGLRTVAAKQQSVLHGQHLPAAKETVGPWQLARTSHSGRQRHSITAPSEKQKSHFLPQTQHKYPLAPGRLLSVGTAVVQGLTRQQTRQERAPPVTQASKGVFALQGRMKDRKKKAEPCGYQRQLVVLHNRADLLLMWEKAAAGLRYPRCTSPRPRTKGPPSTPPPPPDHTALHAGR